MTNTGSLRIRMVSTRVLLFVPLLLAICSSGCDKDSADLTTKDIEATFTVEMDERDPAKAETKISAKLKQSEESAVGPQGDVNLSEGDALSVTTDKNDNLPMPRTSGGTYEVTLPNANAGIFTFHLKRSTASSDGTVFTMPGRLAFTDSPNGKTYGVADTVKFAWSNKAPSRNLAPSKLLVSGSHYPCGGSAVTLAPKNDLPFDDTGTMEILISKLYDTGSPAAGDCVEITIKRTVITDADSAFDKASSATGTRIERLKITIN